MKGYTLDSDLYILTQLVIIFKLIGQICDRDSNTDSSTHMCGFISEYYHFVY